MSKKPLLTGILVGLMLVPPISIHANSPTLPDLGNTARGFVSVQHERELGRAFIHQLRQQKLIMDDPIVTDYLQQLGDRLTRHTDKSPQSFTFMMIDRSEINAFAGPDGYIGVNKGLFLNTQTESELASVLAHEIAHSTQQHLLRAWESARHMNLSQVAIMLAAIALGATAGGDAGFATASIGQAALYQQRINFTRANEKEADRIGIDLMAKAGFEPSAMPAFFHRINRANRIYESRLPEFLLTHPVTNQRIAEALDRAGDYPYRQTRDELRYDLMRERLKWHNLTDPQQALAHYQTNLAEGRYRRQSAAEYGRALALYSADRLTDADQAMRILVKRHPAVPEFAITQAYIEAERHQVSQALRRLQRLLEDVPASYAAYLAYGEIALGHGRHRAALQRLRQAVQFMPDKPRLYELLSRAAGQLKQRAQATRYLAEKHALNGDYDTAILQLENARKIPGLNFYQSAKIESRLQELKSLRDEQEMAG